MRSILHAIPFPRLRLAGDDKRVSDPPVMAGLVPAIPMREPQRPQNRDHRHKAGDDERVSARQEANPPPPYALGSALTRPLARESAPSVSSQARKRAGSTGPGSCRCWGGMRLKPKRL